MLRQEVEATLHCVMSVQEAVPLEPNKHLSLLFSSDILGRLPTSGGHRVQRTMLGLIGIFQSDSGISSIYAVGEKKKGSFASWFTTLPVGSSEPLLAVLGYVVPALSDTSLCLPAANALRDLCDANRSTLAPHITAFGELHAGLSRVQDTEKAKVLQSIASVIQALPPEEEIGPVEVCGHLGCILLSYPR